MICSSCGEEKHQYEFYHGRRQCKSCLLIRQEDRRQRYRNLISDLKDVPCADCGQRFPTCVMDFDHLNPNDKEFKISKTGNYSYSRLIKEVQKCQVVCANCHRIRHNE